jgi:hypothetical protein
MKTTTFYIYEVPGHKNGCTTEWQKRSQYNFSMYGVWPILIETYNYPDEPEYWQIVGDREWELAEKNGYSKGQHYRHAREQRILGVRKNVESGQASELGKIYGKIYGGINLPPKTFEHQSNAGKIGGLKNIEEKTKILLQHRPTWSHTSKFRNKEKVLYNAKNNGGTGKIRDCIYCGRSMNLMNIGRHENICKQKQ